MAMSPKNRAKAAVSVSRAVGEYHVYDDRLTKIGDSAIITRTDGSRVVRLSAAQAQYVMEQGVIGTVPFDQLSDTAQAARKRFRA